MWFSKGEIDNNVFWGLVFLVVVGAVAYLWQGLPGYPHREDSIATIGVIDQIAGGAIPWGEPVFERSPLGHILMAFPVWMFGPSNYTYRISNLVFFALSLLVIIKMGEHLGFRFGGLVAAGFVAFSPIEGLIASYVRYYAPFQFFFLFACYLICKYLTSEDKRNLLAATAVVFCSFFVHKLSLHLFAFALISFLCIQKWSLLKDRLVIASGVSLTITVYMVYFREKITIAAEDFNAFMIGDVGSLFKSDRPLFFYHQLSTYAPTLWALSLWGVVFAVICKRKTVLAYGFSFLAIFATIVVLTPGDGAYYYGHIFPMGFLFAVITIIMTAQRIKAFILNKNWLQAIMLSLCPVLIFAVLFFFGLEGIDPTKSFGQHLKFSDQKKPHMVLNEKLGPDDVVISSDAEFSRYYLQRPVIFIRQQRDNSNRFSPFPENEGNSSLIDSPEKLKMLFQTTKGSVWLYINEKYQFTVGEELKTLIDQRVWQVLYYDEPHYIAVVRLRG